MARGELFILSAPSGGGKTTLIQSMLAAGRVDPATVSFSVSHTTRRPRRGEVDGRDYHFVDADTFDRMVERGEFLEWAVVHNRLYGTTEAAVVRDLERGLDVILDIDVQGAEQVQARCPEAHAIFILPPSYEELAERLRGRGLDDAEEIARRLIVSASEIECYKRYGYVIINRDVARAADSLATIILDKRQRLERQAERIEEVVRGFARSPAGE